MMRKTLLWKSAEQRGEMKPLFLLVIYIGCIAVMRKFKGGKQKLLTITVPTWAVIKKSSLSLTVAGLIRSLNMKTVPTACNGYQKRNQAVEFIRQRQR